MTTPTEIANDLYTQLKPPAVADAHNYIMSRTPAPLQSIMQGIIDADLNPPPDPSVAVVHNGGAVTVRNWDASTGPGVATVTSGTLQQVQATAVASKAIIANGGAVTVHSLADANLPGSPGTATVAAGVFTKVNLTA